MRALLSLPHWSTGICCYLLENFQALKVFGLDTRSNLLKYLSSVLFFFYLLFYIRYKPMGTFFLGFCVLSNLPICAKQFTRFVIAVGSISHFCCFLDPKIIECNCCYKLDDR